MVGKIREAGFSPDAGRNRRLRGFVYLLLVARGLFPFSGEGSNGTNRGDRLLPNNKQAKIGSRARGVGWSRRIPSERVCTVFVYCLGSGQKGRRRRTPTWQSNVHHTMCVYHVGSVRVRVRAIDATSVYPRVAAPTGRGSVRNHVTSSVKPQAFCEHDGLLAKHYDQERVKDELLQSARMPDAIASRKLYGIYSSRRRCIFRAA